MTHSFKLIQKQKFEEGGDGGNGGDGQDPNKNGNGGDGGEGGGNDPSKQTPKPTDREAELLKEVMKRKGNEQTLKTELETVKANLAKFEGIDVDQVRQLLTEKAERETQELERRGEFDRVKEQMKQAHTQELTTLKSGLEGQVNELTTKLASMTSQITELTIGRSFSDSSFVRENLTLTPAKARVVFGSHFELQDGRVVAYDKPAGAPERTVLVDSAGEPVPFDVAIEKIVKADPDADHLVKSKLKSGSGSKHEPGAKPKPVVGSGRDRIAAAVNSGALKM